MKTWNMNWNGLGPPAEASVLLELGKQAQR